MKKLFLLFLALVATAAYMASAQTQKGNWLVGGSGTFSLVEQGEYEATAFGISPMAGYFVAENLAIGGMLNFSSFKEEDEDASTSFSIGPFVRYYFVNLGPSAKLFGQGNIAFGSAKSSGDSEGFTQWGLSAGPAIFLNPHTALEITLGYGSQKYKAVDASSAFGVNIGFQIHLGGGGK